MARVFRLILLGQLKVRLTLDAFYIFYSRRACENGAIDSPVLGSGDPRDVKEYLDSKGIKCWMDIEQAGKV